MRLLIAGLAVAVLAGCSIEGRKSDGPDFRAETAKTPAEYARCLGPKWLAINPGTTSIETEHGFMITASSTFYGVISMASIAGTSSGAAVEAYFPVTKLGTAGWRQPVVDCL